MSNVDPANPSTYAECATANLDAQVRDVLVPLRFSDSPQMWTEQLHQLSSEIYRSSVRRTKDTIRAVAQEFRGVERTRWLLDGVRDTIGRIEVLQSMLEAMDVLALPGARATAIESDRLHHVHSHIPTLRESVDSITSRLSLWQDEFGACQDVFSILELPAATLEPLLVSLSASIPDADIVRGRIVMQRLIALWNERRDIAERAIRPIVPDDEVRHLEERLDAQREIQDSVLVSFSVLLERLHEAPSAPVCFHGQEFPVCQFLGAGHAFSRLRSQQINISQDMGRLERILDRFMDLVEA